MNCKGKRNEALRGAFGLAGRLEACASLAVDFFAWVIRHDFTILR